MSRTILKLMERDLLACEKQLLEAEGRLENWQFERDKLLARRERLQIDIEKAAKPLYTPEPPPSGFQKAAIFLKGLNKPAEREGNE